MLWNPLDQTKISKFSLNFDQYLINENDERVKTNPNRQLFQDMIALKEYRSEDFDDETVDRKQISVQDIKTKANIEEFFNKAFGQNSSHNTSNSINFDDVNRKFSVGINKSIEFNIDANSKSSMPISKSINMSTVKKFPLFTDNQISKLFNEF